MAMNRNGAAARFRAMRDELRDPLLTILTVLLIILIFVIVPLHAAGTISAEGHGFLIILLSRRCGYQNLTKGIDRIDAGAAET